MKTNEGTIDRVVRIILGLVLVGLASSGTIGAWGWIGIIPLVTGLSGFCLLYKLLGTDTCPANRCEEK